MILNFTGNQKQPEPTYEDLLDIVEAQNALIAELQNEIMQVQKDADSYTPPVIENGVIVKLGRLLYRNP